MSVFLVKNLLGIIFGIVEVYDCSYEYHEFCKGQGEFTEQPKEVETLEKDGYGKENDAMEENHNNGNQNVGNGVDKSDVIITDTNNHTSF